LSIIALIFNDVLGPTVFTDPLFAWLDHESMRLFSTVMTLSMAFSAGVYCFKKFITNPKPDEIVIE
jgi:hypothetical protein